MNHPIYVVTTTSIKPLEKRLVLSICGMHGIPAECIKFMNYGPWLETQDTACISLLAMKVQFSENTKEFLATHKWIDHPRRGVVFSCDPLADILNSPGKFFDLVNTLNKIAKFYTDYKPLADSITSADIHIAQSSQEFINIIIEGSKDNLLDCDIETRGFDFIHNSILQLGICYAPGKAVTISNTIALKDLKPLQQLFDSKDYIFCWTNGKFDIKFLRYQWQANARVDRDLYLMSYAMDERKGVHGLEYQAENVLNIESYKGKFSFETIDECDEVLVTYLGKDVTYQRAVRTYREQELEANPNSHKLYHTVLMPSSETLARVEMNGIPVDVEYAKSLDVKYSRMLVEKKKIIVDTAKAVGFDPQTYAQHQGTKSIPEQFNPASPKQLSYLLLDVLRLPMYKKTRTTAEDALSHWLINILKFPIHTIDEFEGVEADVSDQWLNMGTELEKRQKNIIYSILYFRRFSKLHSTYITTVLEKHKDSRVHATFKLGGTVTGRLSSEGPNLQNIPRRKEIKNMFAAGEGKTLIEVDYSQAELRVLAYLSQDPVLIATYVEDRDLHDAVATQIWGPNFTKEQRVGAKTINFGLAYGRGAASVAEQLNIPKSDAVRLMDQWFDAMPTAGAWIKNARQSPYRENPVTPFGRTRRFGLTTRINANSHENEAVNFPIQSVASDLTLQSATELQNLLDIGFSKGKCPAKIVNIVHDAILIECEDAWVDEIAMATKNIMESLPTRLLNTTIPFKAEVEVSKKGWGSKTAYVPKENQ